MTKLLGATVEVVDRSKSGIFGLPKCIQVNEHAPVGNGVGENKLNKMIVHWHITFWNCLYMGYWVFECLVQGGEHHPSGGNVLSCRFLITRLLGFERSVSSPRKDVEEIPA